MPDQNTILAVQQRLAAARQRLSASLHQQAIHGPGYVPPGIIADIADARDTIQYCKSVLRGYDVLVDDLADDFPTEGSDANSTSFAKERVEVLARLQSFWIEGVLNQSLHNVTLLELGLSYDPESVTHPWEMVVEVPGLKAEIVAGTPIVQIFDAQDGRLLILGAPGAGKTTMLLELARALLGRARADRRFPLPVILHLAHWSPIKPDKRPRLFAEWVAEEISQRYDVSSQVATEWLQQSALILLLDGLDEVASGQRQPCIEAINTFRTTHPSIRMAVCSRIEEYEQAKGLLKLNGAIRIAPLTQLQIDAYLQRLGESTQSVRTLLANEPELQELSTTPLLLNIMIMAYRDLASQPQLASNEVNWRSQIFTDYVERMLRQKGINRRYPTEKVVGWLSWIAGQLWVRNRSSFAIKSINEAWQPSKITHFGGDDEPSIAVVVGGGAGAVVGIGVSGGGLGGVVTVPLGSVIGAMMGWAAHEYAFRSIIRPRVIKNLQQKGLIPDHLEDFLEYCVHIIFMRKVGLEYIFIHRLLLERFVFWDTPQLIFEESEFLEGIKQFLATLPGAISPIPSTQYTQYRWVIVQYFEAEMPEGASPAGFIRWLSQKRTNEPKWFKKWFPPPTQEQRRNASEQQQKPDQA